MAWMECNIMDQKLKFIGRILEGEKMAPLCREYNISRKTGYKLWNRYKDIGNEALIAQKRTPYRYANKIPLQVEALILDTKKEFPNWGAAKIREKIKRRFSDIRISAISTIHAVLDILFFFSRLMVILKVLTKLRKWRTISEYDTTIIKNKRK